MRAPHEGPGDTSAVAPSHPSVPLLILIMSALPGPFDRRGESPRVWLRAVPLIVPLDACTAAWRLGGTRLPPPPSRQRCVVRTRECGITPPTL